MILRFILPICVTVLTFSSYAQNEEKPFPSRTVFIELGGKGFASLNFDYRFHKNHSITGGVTLLDYTWEDFTVPDSITGKTLPTPSLMYNFLIGKNGHYLELGAGASILPYWGKKYDENDSPYSLHGVVGYRFQRSDRFFARAGFCPFYRINWAFLPLPGISFGYSW